VTATPATGIADEIAALLESENEVHIDVASSEVGTVISLAEAGSFPAGKADLTPAAQRVIAKLADLLRSRPVAIRVEGHTDDRPIHTSKYESNWELSTARASRVIVFLIEQAGLSPDRLSAAGYGEYRPKVPNTPGRARNRRVDIVVWHSDPSRNAGACRLWKRRHTSVRPKVALSMLLIGGVIAVVLAVAGGYLWEGGKLALLWQPAEFFIIAGCATGILLVSTPMSVLGQLMGQVKRLMTPPPGRKDFDELLVMLYQLFRVAQSTGAMALEPHFDSPKESSVLSKYPNFARHGASRFSPIRSASSSSAASPPTISITSMYEDLEIRQREALMPSGTLMKVGDALPGLGIVAAVLGVVITMQAIDGPPAEIGHKVGAALVGTFLGILLSYGFVQPVAASLEHRVTEELNIEQTIKAGVLALHKGFAPAIAVEFARRVIPEEIRPSFEETEELCRAARAETTHAAAA
jgi:chemotaxis protein MotA